MGNYRDKAVKITKKTGRAFAWLLGILLFFTADLYLVLRSPKAQTWISQKIAAYMGEEIGTKIRIGGVDIELFTKVVLEGIYVEDRHQDTLLYAGKFKVDIHQFSYDSRFVSLSGIDLYDATVKLKKYPGEKGLSYRFIEQYFKSTDTTKTKEPSPWKVNFGTLGLHNIQFAFIDTRWNDVDRGMDYEDIRVTGLNALFSDINPMGDSASFRIRQLIGKERSGFTLTGFTALMTVADTFARFDNLLVTTPDSKVNGFLTLSFHDRDDIADDFVHLVTMDAHFSETILQMGDVGYFAPEFLGMNKKFLVTGDVKGTVEHLRCKNMDIRFGEKSHLAGNFSFNGLPDVENTDMHFKIREALTNRHDLEGIPVAPFGKDDHLELSPSLGRLGDMRFAGSFEGFLHDFVAHGKLGTALGTLSLENLAMLNLTDSLPVTYTGRVNADAFNLGTFLGETDLGRISGSVSVEGTGFPTPDEVVRELLEKGKRVDPFHATLTGNLSLFEYRGYPYSGIDINDGSIRNNFFEGKLAVNDPNLKMGFKGKADLSGKMPVLDFDAEIDSSSVGKLGFLPKDHEHQLSGNISMHLTGNNIDNIEGLANIENLRYSRDGEMFRFSSLDLVAGTTAQGRRLNLYSDMLVASVDGQFQLLKLPGAIDDIMSDFLPAYFPPVSAKEKKDLANQAFHWDIQFKKNTRPLQAIVPGLEIAPNTVFSGSFNSNTHVFQSALNSERIVYKGYTAKGINIGASNKAGQSYCEASGQIDRLQMNDTLGLDRFVINLRASNNDLLTKLNWTNTSSKKNNGEIMMNSHFENQHAIRNSILKAEMNLNDSAWSVGPGNYVRLDTGRIDIHELVFKSGNQLISLDGAIGENPRDELSVNLKNFNLAYLNILSQPRGITLAGYVQSGETGLSDLYHTPIFNSELTFKAVKVNGQLLGDGLVLSSYIAPKEAVRLDGYFSRGVKNEDSSLVKNIVFEGFYYPKKKENSLDIDADLENIRLEILQPYLKSVCSKLVGQFGGDLHIGGVPEKPAINGKMNIQVRQARIDYLGLNLSAFQQPVIINENDFEFNDFKLTDPYGDTATVYGHLYHDNFDKFQFDMDFAFEHFMVLNTSEKDNELFYGKVFATGYLNIFGFIDETLKIDMHAHTDKIFDRNKEEVYSVFNIPMSTTSEADNSDFVTIKQPQDTGTIRKKGQISASGIDFKLIVDATPDAVVKVIFDKTVGDELVAFGNGTIDMHITPSGEFSMRGQYQVEKGNYNFTMKNVIYVPFELSRGGVISWNGDPYEAQIHADAVYKVTASVEPFFLYDSTNQAYHRSYPVDVIMHLDNDLMNPDIGFDISLPTADQNIQETVKSHTQTDLERNRQVLSLMVLSSFMTPSELRQGTDAGVNYSNAGSTLLSNFASGVLNNWLSQINSDLNMEVKYRNGDEVTPQELKLYLGTQLLNNRITIDGNVGKVNATQSTATGNASQWVGDVNVEYKVTADGHVRVRAFNRSNDNTMMNASSPFTQGVGVFYREDFETWEQLMDEYKQNILRENPNRKKVIQAPPPSSSDTIPEK